MTPTEGYMLFEQADRWGIPARKLLTGQDAPLLNLEWKLWATFRQAKYRLEQQHSQKHR